MFLLSKWQTCKLLATFTECAQYKYQQITAIPPSIIHIRDYKGLILPWFGVPFWNSDSPGWSVFPPVVFGSFITGSVPVRGWSCWWGACPLDLIGCPVIWSSTTTTRKRHGRSSRVSGSPAPPSTWRPLMVMNEWRIERVWESEHA